MRPARGGVFNVVTGQGAVAGKALGLHRDVDVLVFTGSGRLGRRLEYSARPNLKRVFLALGSKSPDVVFAHAPDLRVAAKVSAAGIFRTSGPACVAGSRLLVERRVHAEFVEMLADEARAIKVGDPLDLTTQAGAIASEAQLSRVAGHVATVRVEGATLITGGARLLTQTGGS